MANEAENTNLKAQILQVAGRMFLEYGYSGTTFQKIADELNITKGSITYHFKNKFLIMEIFIDDFFNQLKAYIDSYPDEYRNIYWRYCIMYIYAYRRIMRTPRNIELFYHKDQQTQWQTHKINMVSHIYEQIEQDFHKSYEMADLQMKAYMDMGARSRLFSVYQENPVSMTLDQYCYYHIYLIGALCKLDEQTTRRTSAPPSSSPTPTSRRRTRSFSNPLSHSIKKTAAPTSFPTSVQQFNFFSPSKTWNRQQPPQSLAGKEPGAGRAVWRFSERVDGS